MRAKPVTRPCPACGRSYEWRRASGRTFDLCEHCRQPDCVVCGKKVPPERGRKNTCCEACERDKIRYIQNRHYAKRISEDPELNKRHHAKAAVQRLADPEKMAAHKNRERERHQKRQQNPEYLAKRREYQARRYAENAEQIQQQRAEFWQALPETEKEKRRIAARERSRVWRQEYRETLRQDPEAWAAYQTYQRQAGQKHRQQRALAELMKQTQELLNATEQNPTEPTEH